MTKGIPRVFLNAECNICFFIVLSENRCLPQGTRFLVCHFLPDLGQDSISYRHMCKETFSELIICNALILLLLIFVFYYKYIPVHYRKDYQLRGRS